MLFQLEHIGILIVTHLDYWWSTCYSLMVCSACLSALYPEGNWYLRHRYEHFRMSAKLRTYGFDPTTSYNHTLFFTVKFSVLKDFLWWTVPYSAAFVSFEQMGKWNAGLYSIIFCFVITDDAKFLSYSLFLTQRGVVTMTILTAPWYRTYSNGAKKTYKGI